MGFIDLLNELKDAIVTHLKASDMANLSRTCSNLHEYAACVMYRSISMTWERYVQVLETHICDLPLPKIGSLLETVLHRRCYAETVKSMEFQVTNCNKMTDS